MFEIYNRSSQSIPLIINGETVVILSYQSIKVDKLTQQIENLINRNIFRVRNIKR